MMKQGLPNLNVDVYRYKQHHHLSDAVITIIFIAALVIGLVAGWKLTSMAAKKKERKLYSIINSGLDNGERFLLDKSSGKIYFKQTCSHCGRKHY